MTDHTEDIVPAYKCKICGGLYQYNVNKDKIHIILDYIIKISTSIFILWIIFWIIYSIIT